MCGARDTLPRVRVPGRHPAGTQPTREPRFSEGGWSVAVSLRAFWGRGMGPELLEGVFQGALSLGVGGG